MLPSFRIENDHVGKVLCLQEFKYLNLHHQINVFNDGKFPVGTIPFLHDHFRFGMMATCNYCCKPENYLNSFENTSYAKRNHINKRFDSNFSLTSNLLMRYTHNIKPLTRLIRYGLKSV